MACVFTQRKKIAFRQHIKTLILADVTIFLFFFFTLSFNHPIAVTRHNTEKKLVANTVSQKGQH